MRHIERDVVVIGAGPAGSSAALRIARAGFGVALVDRQRFPRFKPCGEFMSPEVLPMLRELGVHDEIRERGAREVRGMLLHARGKSVLGRFVDVGRAAAPYDYGWAVRREVLDDVLVRAAVATGGVELLEGFSHVGLLRSAGGTIEGALVKSHEGEPVALRGKFTLAADGVHSRVARELGVQRETPWLDKLALTTHYRGVPWGDRAEVHFLEHGFFAAAPVDASLVSVNLVLERSVFEAEGLPRDEAFDAWLARTPALSERLLRGTRSSPLRGIARFATTTTQRVFDGAALVGDACGYVDPVTGEGIYFALKGGEFAADAVCGSLRGRRRGPAALSTYEEARRRELAPRAAFATLLQRGLRRPALVRAALTLLRARPRLADVLVSVAGDYVPLRELTRPSVWIGALGSSSAR